jgi:hypothetical protein
VADTVDLKIRQDGVFLRNILDRLAWRRFVNVVTGHSSFVARCIARVLRNLWGCLEGDERRHFAIQGKYKFG